MSDTLGDKLNQVIDDVTKAAGDKIGGLPGKIVTGVGDVTGDLVGFIADLFVSRVSGAGKIAKDVILKVQEKEGEQK